MKTRRDKVEGKKTEKGRVKVNERGKCARGEEGKDGAEEMVEVK